MRRPGAVPPVRPEAVLPRAARPRSGEPDAAPEDAVRNVPERKRPPSIIPDSNVPPSHSHSRRTAPRFTVRGAETLLPVELARQEDAGALVLVAGRHVRRRFSGTRARRSKTARATEPSGAATRLATPPTVSGSCGTPAASKTRGELLVCEDRAARDEDERDVARPRGEERRAERDEVRGRPRLERRSGEAEAPRGDRGDGGLEPRVRDEAGRARRRELVEERPRAAHERVRPEQDLDARAEERARRRRAVQERVRRRAPDGRAARACQAGQAVGVRRDEVDRGEASARAGRARRRPRSPRCASRLVPSARCIVHGPAGPPRGASRTDCAVGIRGTRTREVRGRSRPPTRRGGRRSSRRRGRS